MKNVVLGLFLLFSLNVNAGVINIDVSADTANIGDTVAVDIVGSGFADFDFFNFDVLFDTAVFSFDPANIVTDLPVAGLFGFGIQAVEVPGIGANFSFLDLFPFGGGAFSISFDLSVIGAGVSDLLLSTSDIGQGFFVPQAGLPEVLSISQNFDQLTVSEVPEPSLLMIFALAMFGLIGYRKLAK